MAADVGSAQAGPTPQKRGDWRQYTKYGFVGILVVLALIFIFQNTQKVPLKFLWLDFRAQRWAMFLISFVGGGLAGLVIGGRRSRRRRLQGR